MKIKIFLFFILAGIGAAFFFFFKNKTEPSSPKLELYPGISYEAIDPSKYSVSKIIDNLTAPTRIKLTPDGNHLLISQLTGEVMAMDRTADGWSSPYGVVKIDTKFPGFPPDEAGLAGIVFSSQFLANKKLFLLYTFRDQDGKTQNRISVTTLNESGGKLKGTAPRQIYQANVAGTGSHQITDGVGVEIEGKPHLLFLIGEGFDGKRAQDPSIEGGKVLLIGDDGSNPAGPRPFVQNPKVEALGIRNAYILVQNPLDPMKRMMIADTGPDHFDRILFTVLATGKPVKAVNFGWDGDEKKLANAIPDPNILGISDMAILRLPDTRTFTGISFLPNGDIVATIFGKTGSKENSPGKEIWLGKISSYTGQPKLAFTPIVRRVASADGFVGNPLGLEFDQRSGNLFFADILEGRVYVIKEVNKNE